MSSQGASLQTKAEEYFASISPTAKRIMEERAFVRSQFQEEWEAMTHDEREDLIYDYFVSPRLQEKYSSTLKIGGDAESFPKLMVNSGARVIVEEDAGNSWRDEHSAPFCWETQSQLNFSYIEHTERDSIIEERKAKKLTVHQNKLRMLRDNTCKMEQVDSSSIQVDDQEVMQEAEPDEVEDEEIIPQTLTELRNAVKGDVEAVLQKKLKNIELGIDDSYDYETTNSDNENGKDIPRSGFDFLDEW